MSRQSDFDIVNNVPKKAPPYKPEGKEKEFVSYLANTRYDLEEYWRPYRNMFGTITELYANNISLDEDGIIEVNLPVELEIVESKVADEIKTLPEAKIIATKGADKDKVMALRAIDESIDNKTKKREVDILGMYYKNIYGTEILEEHYKVTKRKVKQIILPEDEDGVSQESKLISDPSDLSWTEIDVVDYNDCATERVDLRDVLPDMDATSMSDCRIFFRRRRYDWVSFEAKYEDYENFKYVVKGQWDNMSYLDGRRTSTKNLMRNGIGGYRGNDLGKDDVHVWEFWNPITDEFAEQANGVLMTKYGNPIPYDHKQIPYIRKIDHLVPNCFFGKGEVQLIMGLKIEKNTIRNQILRTAIIAANPVVVVPEGLSNDTDDFDFSPGSIWPVKSADDARSVNVLNVRGEVAPLLNLDAKIDENITTLTAVDSKNLISSSGETATKTAVVKESALKRINLGLSLIEADGVLRQKYLRVKNIQQFYKQLDVFIKIDDDGNEVMKKDKKGVVILDKNGKPTPDREAKNKVVNVSGVQYQWVTEKIPGETEDDEEFTVDVLKSKELKDEKERTELEVRPPLLVTPWEIEIIPASELPFSTAFEQQQANEQLEALSNNPRVNQDELLKKHFKAMKWDESLLIANDQQRNQNIEIQQQLGMGSPEQGAQPQANAQPKNITPAPQPATP